MVYDWPTLLACDNATVPLKKSGRCQFQQPSFSGGSKDHLIDLRYFSSVTIDGFISQRGRPSKVNLQPCGPNPLCSPPGSICGKGLQGMGSLTQFFILQFFIHQNEISNSRKVEVEATWRRSNKLCIKISWESHYRTSWKKKRLYINGYNIWISILQNIFKIRESDSTWNLKGGKVDDWVGLAGGVESAVLNLNSDEIVVQFSQGSSICKENVLQNRTAEIR